jgi:hypothetical protein
MQNSEYNRENSRIPGAKIKEFFSWLRGLFSPKYIPQRIRYGDRNRKEIDRKSNMESQLYDDGSGHNT